MKSTALFTSNYLQAFGNLKFAALFVGANAINAIISFTYVSAPNAPVRFLAIYL